MAGGGAHPDRQTWVKRWGGGLVGTYPTKLDLTGQLVFHVVLFISKIIIANKSLNNFNNIHLIVVM